MTHLSSLLQEPGVFRPPAGGLKAIAKVTGRSPEATRAVRVGWKRSSTGKKIRPMLIDGALAVIHWDLWSPRTPQWKSARAFMLDLFGEDMTRAFWLSIATAARRLAGAGTLMPEEEDALGDLERNNDELIEEIGRLTGENERLREGLS